MRNEALLILLALAAIPACTKEAPPAAPPAESVDDEPG
jgi:predicted small lipoprotein YifL